MVKLFPQIYLVYLALAVLVLGGLYLKGRMDGREACNGRIAVIEAESLKRERAEQSRAMAAAAELEQARGKIEVKYRTITKEVQKVVERPVYRGTCLDDDGLRLVNAALKAPAPRQSSNAMPGPSTNE